MRFSVRIYLVYHWNLLLMYQVCGTQAPIWHFYRCQFGTWCDSFKMNGSNREESIAHCLYVPFKCISIIAWRNSMSSLWWLSGKIDWTHFGQYQFLAFAASSRVSLTQLRWFRCLQLILFICAPTCWTFRVQTEHLLVRSMIFVYKSIYHRQLPKGLCIFKMG